MDAFDANTKKSFAQQRQISVIVMSIWFLYIILSPFYIFPKGQPQPADYLLLLAIGPILLKQFLTTDLRLSPVLAFGSAFVVLTIVVNLANYAFFPDQRFLFSAMYYVYNFMIFLFVVTLFRANPTRFKRVTYFAIILTVFIQFVVINTFDFGFRGYRGTAGFENPNQLAYWALLTAAMVIFLKRWETLKLLDFVLIGVLGVLQSLALSKAGIIAYSVFLIFLFMTPKVPKSGYFVLYFLAVILIMFALNEPQIVGNIFGKIEMLQNVTNRLEGIGSEPDDSPEARGYFRLIEHPYYTIVGSGEGGFFRFPDPNGYVRELHSGIATIFFSYGLLGAFLFFGFLTLVLNKQPWHYVLLFAPIILFGLPHQNFRFAHFWVLLGINYGMHVVQSESNGRRRKRIGSSVLPRAYLENMSASRKKP